MRAKVASEMDQSHLSIITINKNNGQGLLRTLKSIASQNCRTFEYIVIDGSSRDESVVAIESHESLIDFWISEPDSGVYEAMNKGIRQAHGDYLLFLNSGDWLVDDGVVGRLVKACEAGADIYYADLRSSDGRDASVVRYPRSMDVDFFLQGTISHQNSVIRKALLVEAGLYREDFRIASDWFFFLHAAYSQRALFKHIGEPFAAMSPGGMGNDPRFDAIKADEYARGVTDLFGPLAPSLLALRAFRGSSYGYLIRTFGNTQLLQSGLKAYRFFARRMKYLQTNLKEP